MTLTPDELAKVKAKHATAALVFHYGGNDWSNAQDAALKAQFAAEGIDVIAVTDAGFKPEKQVADIETVMAKKPDIIVSIPVDPVATAAAYKAAADKGVKLVFMDNVPKGFTAGKDYVSSVSADNYGNGVAAAHLMAKALRRQGRDRPRLPRRRLLRHPPALRRLQEDDPGAVSRHQDRRRAGHRRSGLLRRRREGRRRDPDRAPDGSTRSGRSGTFPPKA